ncbi:hypothetical protein [Streptomyces sp. CAU 1734]|uniref:hypothetical protein n=1 Tax=Streptomyces sp. CAU 1734 TaxID=3140360 RepID=UPI003261B229
MGTTDRMRPTHRDPQAGQRCPECGEPVGAVITRRKTLGAFVPFWGPGPCRNPECAEYTAEHHAERSGDGPGAALGSV